MRKASMLRNWYFVGLGLLAVGLAIWYIWVFMKKKTFDLVQEDVQITESDYEPEVERADPRPQLTSSPFHITTISVQKNSSIYTTFQKAGIETSIIHEWISVCASFYDLSSIAAGVKIELRTAHDTEELQEIFIEISSLLGILIQRQPHQTWYAEKIEKNPVTELVTVEGKIENTLWESAAKAGLHSQVIYELTDIFSAQIDFEREIHTGDSWSVVLEKRTVDGKFYDWGKIQAVRYTLQDVDHKAVLFTANGKRAYFTPEGESLDGMFLKSPLKFSRITSTFQLKRFHPILKINRPHHGVDYAASTGTPIHAVAEGRIEYIGWQNGGGNIIRIRHNSTYETAYKHMSRFGSGLHKNSRVQQGETIGYVGMTGLATAPHLHFEFYENGKYRDPLGIKFPRKESLSKEQRLAFLQQSKKMLALLQKPDIQS